MSNNRTRNAILKLEEVISKVSLYALICHFLLPYLYCPNVLILEISLL